MLLGALSALLLFGAGCLTLRLIRLPRDAIGLSLAPAIGIALLAVISTGAQQAQLAEPVIGLIILAIAFAGLVIAAREAMDRQPWRDRVSVAVLAVATLIPAVVLATTTFVQSGVPDYSYDGPFHAETVEAMRHGGLIAGAGWYPTGFHGPAAALLSLVPSIDSATGVVGWATAFTLLAPLTLFGLTVAVWGDRRVGAAAALLLALTSTFPYGPQIYSEWPMLAGLLLVVGLWTVCIQYLSKPDARLAIVAGLLTGAIVLIHGTESYTAAIGVVALAITRWRSLLSRRLFIDVALAGCVAIVAAAPYLPALLHWSANGGALSAGSDYYPVYQAHMLHDPVLEALFWASSTSSGLLVDLPFRLALLVCGAWLAAQRRTGRVLVALTAVFLGLVAVFRFVDAGVVRQVFALTMPWAVDGRLLTTVPILVAPVEGLALAWIAGRLVTQARQATAAGHAITGGKAFARRAVAFGIALGAAAVLLTVAKFHIETSNIVTYSADDAAAFAWLHQHAQQGDVLLNDGAADAGIWAPYKTGLQIVLLHSRPPLPDGPETLVRTNLDALDARQDVTSAACSLDIKYVYHGEAPSTSERREFPSLESLRNNPVLQEVFSRGDAAIFQTRLQCA